MVTRNYALLALYAMRSLDVFPSEDNCPLNVNVFLGKQQRKKPVSSTLKSYSGSQSGSIESNEFNLKSW